jgi:hypothetical protein
MENKWLQSWLGKSTVFAAAIFVTSTILCIFHRIDGGAYAAICGTIAVMVPVRAMGDDYHERAMRGPE